MTVEDATILSKKVDLILARIFYYCFTLVWVPSQFYIAVDTISSTIEREKHQNRGLHLLADIKFLEKQIVKSEIKSKRFMEIQKSFNDLTPIEKEAVRKEFAAYTLSLDSIDRAIRVTKKRYNVLNQHEKAAQ